MKKILSIVTAVLLYITVAFGQAIDISLMVTDNDSHSQVIRFGLDPLATDGIDAALLESDLPPPPPGNAFDARFWLPPFGGALSSLRDYRTAAAFPFTGTKEHVIKFQSTVYPITVSWNLPPQILATSTIKDPFNLQVISFSGTGSIVITNSAIGQVNISIDYENIEPVEPGPLFAVNPASLDFGSVGVGGTFTQTLTVSNNGATNPLSITAASSNNAAYTVIPNPPASYPIEIAAGGTYRFDVQFIPLTTGVISSEVQFTHNAPGSPSNVPVTGIASDVSQILFTSDYHLRVEKETYTDTLRLIYNGGTPLNSLSFKLRSNPPGSEDILVLTGVEKGNDIASSDWNFFYELKEGGASDYMIVLIYGQDLTTLPAGTYNDFIRFTYSVVDITGLDTLTSAFKIEEVSSSYINGDPAGVIGDDDQIVDGFGLVYYGDINIDWSVDILDLIMVRDYILEKITFNEEQMIRADLAPWTSGNPEPTPDGVVNVQDLSLLQNIILTGGYPAGTPILKAVSNLFYVENTTTPKEQEANLTFSITEGGIEIKSNTPENIIGLELELENVNTSDMTINTSLGKVYFNNKENSLRVLCYDGSGKIELPSGENTLASMFFRLDNPSDIKINRIILVNSRLEKIPQINVEINYDGTITQLPTEYALKQNYPNPFNPATTIEFSIPSGGFVTLKIYDILGREVKTLFSGQMEAGSRKVTWDSKDNNGMNVSSGNYIYRMTSGDYTNSKKMILIR